MREHVYGLGPDALYSIRQVTQRCGIAVHSCQRRGGSRASARFSRCRNCRRCWMRRWSGGLTLLSRYSLFDSLVVARQLVTWWRSKSGRCVSLRRLHCLEVESPRQSTSPTSLCMDARLTSRGATRALFGTSAECIRRTLGRCAPRCIMFSPMRRVLRAESLIVWHRCSFGTFPGRHRGQSS